MELSFLISNDHRARNTGCHGYNFSLNRRKSKSGIEQADYAHSQKDETTQRSEYKPVHGDVSFLHENGSRTSSHDY
ncbi:MAG: hypothetical protein NTAFB01_33260 [Nitrospira sp.]